MNEVTMKLQADELIRMALQEDITSEDVSTNAVMPTAVKGTVDLIAKQDGIIAGLDVYARVFQLLDEKTEFEFHCKDGDEVKKGQLMATVTGDIRVLLSGERVALNYLQRMSGIATYTRQIVKLLEGSGVTLLDTRKTTPNCRIFEKYAVRIGGGCNHRYNLSDGVLLKDNHIGAAGSITKAIQMAKEYAPFVRKIEIETETLEQVQEAVEAGADIIMLDNMTPEMMAKDLGKHSMSYYFQPLLSPKHYFEKKKVLWKEQQAKYLNLYDFIEKKIIRSVGRYFQRRCYNKNNSKTVQYVNFKKKYVYFPLHLQPEMTTDVLGEKYTDQLLAIEKLRNILPDDWYIYVKENPKQKSYMRGRYFFERLSLIPNVVFVDRTIDTYKLMESAQFVSTITGTAAWEAITGGKNALIFGRVWFDHFPGIFRFGEMESIQEILQYRISHEDIQKETNKLRRKLIKGYYKQDTLTHGGVEPQENNDLALLKFFKYIFTK